MVPAKRVVLVTRSGDQGEILLNRIRSLGFDAVLFPLIEIEPLPLAEDGQELLRGIDQYRRVIFVSRNAVHYGLPILRNSRRLSGNIRWYAVGPGTAEALVLHGIKARVPDSATSEGLLALPGLLRAQGVKVLIVRGQGGREELARVLTQRGAEVNYLEVYRRVPVYHAPAELVKIRQSCDHCVALLTAGSALEQLTLQLPENTNRESLTLVVASRRIAELARQLGYSDIEIVKMQPMTR